ncbi:epidermal growth factor-like protein 7 isoform X2 [Megalops cyprinoides]|uniref:epidermal growth factor-like protein 7 isoform X2 n=1 Tax=Megalops cyprinoides TaxID=118141 RepID=UPI001863C09A|nr:epidermal growth factor-like protein 7 isoform X2 [Megalops cyprinoides]
MSRPLLLLCSSLLVLHVTCTPQYYSHPGRRVCGRDVPHHSNVVQSESFIQPIHKPYITLCQGHRLCSTYKTVYRVSYRQVNRVAAVSHSYPECCPGWRRVHSHNCNQDSRSQEQTASSKMTQNVTQTRKPSSTHKQGQDHKCTPGPTQYTQQECTIPIQYQCIPSGLCPGLCEWRHLHEAQSLCLSLGLDGTTLPNRHGRVQWSEPLLPVLLQHGGQLPVRLQGGVPPGWGRALLRDPSAASHADQPAQTSRSPPLPQRCRGTTGSHREHDGGGSEPEEPSRAVRTGTSELAVAAQYASKQSLTTALSEPVKRPYAFS